MPGPGFPPVVRRPILGHAAVRVIGTVTPVVDRSAYRSQLLRHPAVKGGDLPLSVEPSGDTRLIRRDEHVIAGVIEPLHRLSGAVHPIDLARRMNIAVVQVEDAVAVQKGRRSPP